MVVETIAGLCMALGVWDGVCELSAHHSPGTIGGRVLRFPAGNGWSRRRRINIRRAPYIRVGVRSGCVAATSACARVADAECDGFISSTHTRDCRHLLFVSTELLSISS